VRADPGLICRHILAPRRSRSLSSASRVLPSAKPFTTSSVDHSSSDRVEPFERTVHQRPACPSHDALADLRPLRQPVAAFRLRCPRPAFRGRTRPRQAGLAVIDPFLAGTPFFDDTIGAMTAAGLDMRANSEITPELPVGTLDAAGPIAREYGADVLVAIGGGSALDAAKLIALLSTHHGRLDRHYGENQVLPIEPAREVLLDILERAHHGSSAVNRS
jgi:Iron-containing alcohol dehydrogenase